MIRRPASAGLILLGVLALLATLASAATGTEAMFAWGAGATEVEMSTDLSHDPHLFEMGAGASLSCNNVRLAGRLPTGTREGELFTTRTSTYNFIELGKDRCEDLLGVGRAIAMNGCGYRFHAGTTVVEGEARGTLDVVCPAGKEIGTGIGVFCRFRIPPQSGLSGVVYRAGEVEGPFTALELEIAVDDIEYEQRGLCGSGRHGDGRYTGFLLVAGWRGAAGAPFELK